MEAMSDSLLNMVIGKLSSGASPALSLLLWRPMRHHRALHFFQYQEGMFVRDAYEKVLEYQYEKDDRRNRLNMCKASLSARLEETRAVSF